jgi:hydroxymethylbilane synthase
MSSSAFITVAPPIILASRASRLAMVQAEEVKERLSPREVRIETFSTRGDEILDRPLAEIGGKGLFVKTLEKAILAGEADAAVHSSKDMEAGLAAGTELMAFLERGDRRDALIGGYASFDELPQGGVIGTASVRRTAIIKSHRPDLETRLLRGNVTSRLKQLADGDYDAIILAMAGLNRLGINEDVHPIAEEVMLPASGQGAIAVQARSSDGSQQGDATAAALMGLNHAATAAEVKAERTLLATLDGTCHTPIAASAHFTNGRLTMRAQLFSLDGSRYFSVQSDAAAEDGEDMARDLGLHLLRQAGDKFMREQRQGTP